MHEEFGGANQKHARIWPGMESVGDRMAILGCASLF
jgi:hypothetical protein